MPRFREKPIIIEAFQWDGTDKCLDSVNWICDKLDDKSVERTLQHLYIKTLEGVMKADIGDYIIKGVNGELYPCKPDIFKKTYVVIKL